ncbi:leucine-rich repeat extensin-like protein 3 [Diospyros lotus]|uniref:leucine-rich repeat extensin-like protein 3 n=1 Tax=Diospyros lotus TaxID=55363 RepID=UPI00224CD4FE|nr:leucine-rich repeat extensin-like protein 3 [Diospyros lotus]
MAEKKVTIMVLKVDLQCPSCYKKVKKLLCKYPQIRSQIFDEKQNTVTITVVCCSPEKIRDKLYCKGGKTIKCIQILEPPKPPNPKSDPPPPKKDPAPKVDPPPAPKVDPPKVDPPKKDPAPPPAPAPKVDPPKKDPPPKVDPPPPKVDPPPPAKRVDPPPLLPPAPAPVPVRVCCGSCYEGRTGGPCYHGYGRPVPCYDGDYGYGGGRVCYVSRCDDYFSDENATGCTIM